MYIKLSLYVGVKQKRFFVRKVTNAYLKGYIYQ